MTKLIEERLGDQKGETAEEIRRTLAIGLYEFRNPATFHKQENNDTTDDDEDL